jgi:hypothetical protein
MALGTFIAGRYTNTYNSGSCGMTKDGFRVTHQFFIDVIGESDAYGQSPIDGIFRGGECYITFTGIEGVAGAFAALWPFGTDRTTPLNSYGILVDPTVTNKTPVGTLATDLARAFVMTGVSGTPAVTAGTPYGPATLTITKALLRENYPVELLFNSKLKEIPISLRAWPVDAGSGVIKFFTTT